MEVQIVTFPETKVAALEHRGPPALEYDTVRKLIAWKLENQLFDQSKYRSYGIHYADQRITSPSDHRVDFCLSFNKDVGRNPYGIRNFAIPDYVAPAQEILALARTTRPLSISTKCGCLKAVNHPAISQSSSTTSTSARMCRKRK